MVAGSHEIGEVVWGFTLTANAESDAGTSHGNAYAWLLEEVETQLGLMSSGHGRIRLPPSPPTRSSTSLSHADLFSQPTVLTWHDASPLTPNPSKFLPRKKKRSDTRTLTLQATSCQQKPSSGYKPSFTTTQKYE